MTVAHAASRCDGFSRCCLVAVCSCVCVWLQFYVWYYHTLPLLLYLAPLPNALRLLLLVLIEYSWNVFPATATSSGQLERGERWAEGEKAEAASERSPAADRRLALTRAALTLRSLADPLCRHSHCEPPHAAHCAAVLHAIAQTAKHHARAAACRQKGAVRLATRVGSTQAFVSCSAFVKMQHSTAILIRIKKKRFVFEIRIEQKSLRRGQRKKSVESSSARGAGRGL